MDSCKVRHPEEAAVLKSEASAPIDGARLASGWCGCQAEAAGGIVAGEGGELFRGDAEGGGEGVADGGEIGRVIEGIRQGI